MSLISRVLRNGGVWVAPLALLILLSRVHGQEESGEGYHTAVVLMDVSAVTLIAPMVALVAAWESCKLRFARVLVQPRVRSTPAIVVQPLSCAAAPACLVLTIFAAVDGPAMSLADGLLILTGVITVAAWALFGFGVAAVVKPVIALPLAMLVPALWLIFARAYEPLWLRHLTGAWTGCCFTNETVALAPLASSVVFNLAVGVAGALLVRGAARNLRDPEAIRRGALAGLAVVIVAGAVAGALVQDFGYSPGVMRTEPTVCDQAPAQLCLWPEHESVREGVRAELDAAAAAWRAAGIAIPETFDEGVSRSQPPAAALIIQSNALPQDWRRAIAQAVITPPACPGRPGPAAEEGEDAMVATGLLLVLAGEEPASITRDLPPPFAARLNALLDQREASVAWVNAVIVGRGGCS